MGIFAAVSAQLAQANSSLASLVVIERSSQSDPARAESLHSGLWTPIGLASTQPLVLIWFFFGIAAISVSTFLVLSARRRLHVAAGRVPLALRPASL